MTFRRLTTLFIMASTVFVLAFSASNRQTKSSVNPWVKNLSKPWIAKRGLADRHLSIWASHGIYFSAEKDRWEWQRPNLFCTREDLLTPSFVYPFLIPMLENAGAVVWTPRERDIQTLMSIADSPHIETDNEYIWQMTPPSEGQYAVYVWYPSDADATSSALYTIHHGGESTQIRVNQQMGADTWVYLGTFFFSADAQEYQSASPSATICLSKSAHANGRALPGRVRLGGGMCHISRNLPGDSTSVPRLSGMPHYLEAARYWTEWAGLPDSLFNTELGMSDYRDDLRARSNMLNWLREVKGVPIELSLGVHTDAGYQSADSCYGSLSICTTVDEEGNHFYPDGTPRKASFDYSALLLQQIESDLSDLQWVIRDHIDKNYSETRAPRVPSAIIEMLSHQHFFDCRMAHDPVFKFRMSRAIYKAILRYTYNRHKLGEPIIQPLPVRKFSAVIDEDEAKLNWKATVDTLEPTAQPTHFIVYTRTDDGDFNNGTLTRDSHFECPIQPGHRYTFRVTAVNDGGESFPSHQLTVYQPITTTSSKASPSSEEDKRPLTLLVDAFTRLSGPAYVVSADSIGFLLGEDFGVPYGKTMEYSGRQLNFEASNPKREGEGALGYGTDEYLGCTITGNTFDICAQRAKQLVQADSTLTIISVQTDALTEDFVANLKPEPAYSRAYSADMAESKIHLSALPPTVYYLAGQQKRAPHNMADYPVWPQSVRPAITLLHSHGARLIVEGAYVSPAHLSTEELDWWRTLK